MTLTKKIRSAVSQEFLDRGEIWNRTKRKQSVWVLEIDGYSLNLTKNVMYYSEVKRLFIITAKVEFLKHFLLFDIILYIFDICMSKSTLSIKNIMKFWKI